jgi:hypothetical protein
MACSTASAFSAWDLQVLSPAQFQALDGACHGVLSTAQARYLLSFSVLAPSSHNSVPQLYALDLAEQAIEILLDRRRVLAVSDPTGRQALISVGCAIENLQVSAASYGLASVWQPEPGLLAPTSSFVQAGPPVRLGRVLFTGAAQVPDAPVREAAWRSLLERRTVRAEFDDRRALPEELLGTLHDGAAADGVVLSIFQSAAEKFAWGKLEEAALKHKLEQAAFRHELGRWLLANDDEISERGMRGREFGLDDRISRELARQLRGEAGLHGDQLALMARGGRMGLSSASAVCALSCGEEHPAHLLDVGRVYQRCSLAAWRVGFVQAVHSAICEVGHVRAMCRATLTRAAGPPSMLFRLGVPTRAPERSRPHSSRPALDSLLVGEPDSSGKTGAARRQCGSLYENRNHDS